MGCGGVWSATTLAVLCGGFDMRAVGRGIVHVICSLSISWATFKKLYSSPECRQSPASTTNNAWMLVSKLEGFHVLRRGAQRDTQMQFVYVLATEFAWFLRARLGLRACYLWSPVVDA